MSFAGARLLSVGFVKRAATSTRRIGLVVCFIAATHIVCEPMKLDRPRGDFEPTVIQKEERSVATIWPPTYGDWRLRCILPKCHVDYAKE